MKWKGLKNMFDEMFKEFKILLMKKYPKILINYNFDGEDFNIYYHIESFNIDDMEFHSLMGKSIKATFYKKNIFNLTLEPVYEYELEDYKF